MSGVPRRLAEAQVEESMTVLAYWLERCPVFATADLLNCGPPEGAGVPPHA
jgi:hypothetical protein